MFEVLISANSYKIRGWVGGIALGESSDLQDSEKGEYD